MKKEKKEPTLKGSIIRAVLGYILLLSIEIFTSYDMDYSDKEQRGVIQGCITILAIASTFLIDVFRCVAKKKGIVKEKLFVTVLTIITTNIIIIIFVVLRNIIGGWM